MVAIINRRGLITSIVSSTLCSSSVLVEDIAKFIVTSTPREFRQAVSSSNQFLYRGAQESSEKQPLMAGQVCSPEPDLLLLETYNNDDKALEYFKCLEDVLKSDNIVARPSRGHIGTPSVKEAAVWGDVVSIWPLGDSLSFVYPKEATTFYPGCSCDGDYVLNKDLEWALQQGREVLFASWYSKTGKTSISSSFLEVPQRYDERLRRLLESMNYGL